nr:holin [Caudoviricetes sp.]CAI9751104.1 holin [Caudoviricetes sp.]
MVNVVNKIVVPGRPAVDNGIAYAPFKQIHAHSTGNTVAVNALFKRLNDNGLKNNFTAEQVEQIVERAYQALKG